MSLDLECELGLAPEPAMALVDEVERDRVSAGLVRRADRDRHEGRLPGSQVVGERRAKRVARTEVGDPDLRQAEVSVAPGLGAEVGYPRVDLAHLAGDERLHGGRLDPRAVGLVRE